MGCYIFPMTWPMTQICHRPRYWAAWGLSSGVSHLAAASIAPRRAPASRSAQRSRNDAAFGAERQRGGGVGVVARRNDLGMGKKAVKSLKIGQHTHLNSLFGWEEHPFTSDLGGEQSALGWNELYPSEKGAEFSNKDGDTEQIGEILNNKTGEISGRYDWLIDWLVVDMQSGMGIHRLLGFLDDFYEECQWWDHAIDLWRFQRAFWGKAPLGNRCWRWKFHPCTKTIIYIYT